MEKDKIDSSVSGFNLKFIATYIFMNPGCSAIHIRRALWVSKHDSLEDFSERYSYISYFYMPKNHRGYPKKYWKSPKRGRWILTPAGTKKITPEMMDFVKNCKQKCVTYTSTG